MRNYFFVAVFAVMFALLGVLMWRIRQPMLKSWRDVLLIPPSIGTALYLANGLVRNSRLLVGTSLDSVKREKLLHVACGTYIIECIFVFFMCILPTKIPESSSLAIVTSVFGLLGLALACSTLPVILIQLVGVPERGRIIGDSGLIGIRHDSFLGFVMIAGAGLTAIHIIESLLLQKETFNGALTFVEGVSLLGVAGAVTAMVGKIFNNNVEHYKTKSEHFIKEHSVEGRKICAPFKEHLERQNTLVFYALWPYSLVFFVIPIVKNVFSKPFQTNPESETGLPVSVKLYNTYFIKLPGLNKYSDKINDALKPLRHEYSDENYWERLIWH
jgi:hypothetical protein